LIPTCLVMAGGRGERFGSPCKFLEEVCGERILSRLLRQLREVCYQVLVALSPHTANCAGEVCGEVPCIALPGKGYAEDLSLVLPALRKPTLVAAADLVTTGRTLLEFAEVSAKLSGSSIGVVTAVVQGNQGEEPVGLALFLKDGGTWVNVRLSGSLMDVDTREDLETANRVCEHLLEDPSERSDSLRSRPATY